MSPVMANVQAQATAAASCGRSPGARGWAHGPKRGHCRPKKQPAHRARTRPGASRHQRACRRGPRTRTPANPAAASAPAVRLPEAPRETRASREEEANGGDHPQNSCAFPRERPTFELSGRRRQDARPGLAKMYRVPPDRAWWPAVGAPLERGVRPQSHHRCDARTVCAERRGLRRLSLARVMRPSLRGGEPAHLRVPEPLSVL